MSYVFMTLLRFRAAILVRTGMVLLTLGPLITGLYYVYAWRRGHGEIWGTTGDKFTEAQQHCQFEELRVPVESQW